VTTPITLTIPGVTQSSIIANEVLSSNLLCGEVGMGLNPPTVPSTVNVCFTGEVCVIDVGTYTSINYACSDMDLVPITLYINGIIQDTNIFPMTTSMSTSANLCLSMTPTVSLIGTYEINVVSSLTTSGTIVTTDTINLEIISACLNYDLIVPTLNPNVYAVTDSPLVF
jgi:hypothetical protein